MKKIIYISLIILIAGSSCVSKKKYLISENGRIEAENRGINLSQQLGECFTRASGLEQDTINQGKRIREYESLLSANMSEQAKLNTMLGQKMDELEKREKTINELQGVIDAQNEKVQSLLNNVKNALLGFSSDELTITEKNGKIYVAMSDKLLFESGSARVNKRGKEALEDLAEVLNKQVDIDVIIEGHTDDKPISTAQFKDNWDLSVIRATSVVRILTKDYGVNPLQIQASGRGEHIPVATNKTNDGRSLNRRTEIILAPKLDELLNLLK